MRIHEIIDEGKAPNNKELRRALLRKGYTSQEGGDHTKFYAPDRSHHIAIPRHQGDLSTGVAKKAMKLAGLTDADF